MEMDDFDVYPISHNGRVYNIITAMDLTFREVRGMIDALVALDAFAAGADAHEARGPPHLRRRGIRLRGRRPGIRCGGLPPRAREMTPRAKFP